MYLVRCVLSVCCEFVLYVFIPFFLDVFLYLFPYVVRSFVRYVCYVWLFRVS